MSFPSSPSNSPSKSTLPQYSRREIMYREEILSNCFNMCDLNGDGLISNSELSLVASWFNPESNTSQEVAIIMNKLDKNQDSHIDKQEWIQQLFELFRFMNAQAFEKHTQELCNLIKEKKAKLDPKQIQALINHKEQKSAEHPHRKT